MEAEMEGCADGGEEKKAPCQSFTTISTVAVQAGQSQLVISVLKSGSVIHVNLVEASPDLCEIGSDQEENQTLVREHQQLLINLKKHESAVTALLSQADQTAEEEEGLAVGHEDRCGHVGGVYEAMADSLKEGWSLLSLLLGRRQLLLQVAAVFYEKAQQFTVSLERAEELQEDPEACRFTRRSLLKRSLQVLNGKWELLDLLRELQNTDSLQTTGAVSHFKDCSAQNCSVGRISELRVEKMVEELQGRRRQLEQNIQERLEQHFTDLKIQDLNIEEQNITDVDVTEQNITSFDVKKQNFLNTREQQKMEQNVTENVEQNIIGKNFREQHNTTEQHIDMGHKSNQHQQVQENQQPVQKNPGEVYQNHQPVQHNQNQQVQKTQQEVHQNHTKQVQKNQDGSERNHWSLFDTLLQKVLQDLVSVEEVLVVSSKVDLGCDPHIVSRLLLNFQRAQPHFTCLDLQVDKVVRMWASLSKDRPPLKEKKADLQRTQSLHQRIRGQIQRCHRVLTLADSFHQTTNQVKALIRTEAEACGGRSSLPEQQVQKLLKRSISLGHSLLNLAEGSPGFSVSRLNKVLGDLERDVSVWLRKTRNRHDNLHANLLLSELRKGLQDVRKRFDIEKISFLKGNDQSVHTSALSTHRRQVELHRDTLQALQGRLSDLTPLLGSELWEGGVNAVTEDAVNHLQRQMSESERSIEGHLLSLHTTHTLRRGMEEYCVWCSDIQALVLTVGGSVARCRSLRSLSALCSQFNACVFPTLVRQEDSIQEMRDMAVKLHGAAEGERLMAWTLGKHSDIMDSISDLQQRMDSEKRRLKVKGQEEWREAEKWRECLQRDEEIVEEQKRVEQTDHHSVENTSDWMHPKESGHTPELIREHHGKEMPNDGPEAANRKPLLEQQSDGEAEEAQASSLDTLSRWESSSCSQEGGHTSCFSSSQTFNLSCSPLVPQRRVLALLSQSQASSDLKVSPSSPDGMLACSKNLNKATQDHQEQEVMSEESLSNDDCVSPDDISLPPLPETPESNVVFSDGEDSACCSSCSAHCDQSSSQHKQHSSLSAQCNQYSSWSSHEDHNQHSAHSGHQYNNQYHMETELGTGLVLEVKSSTGGRASTLEMKGTTTANQPKDAGSSPGCSQDSPSSQSRILRYNEQPKQLSGLFQILCDPHKQKHGCHLSQDNAVHSTTLQSTALESREGVSHDTQCSNDPTACPDTQESHESPVTLFESSGSAVADEPLIHSNPLPQPVQDEPYSCADDLALFLPHLPKTKQLPATDEEEELYQPMNGRESFYHVPLMGEIHKIRVCHHTRDGLDTQGSRETQDSYINIVKTPVYPRSQCSDDTKNSNDALSQLPPQASEPPNFPTSDHKLNVCHPLSVLEAISPIPVISECNDTQVCQKTPVCLNTQYKAGTQEIFDSYETKDSIATKESMIRNLTSTEFEVSWATVGLQPTISLNSQYSHDSQASSDTQGSQVRNDPEDGNSTQYNTKVNHDTQDDTLDSYDTPVCHYTQYSHVTQGSHEIQDPRVIYRSSRSTTPEVSLLTEGLQPCGIFSHCLDDTQYSHDAQFHHDIQGSQDGLDNQNSHETEGSNDTQKNDETQVCHDSQFRNDIHSSYDTKDSLKSPISLVQSSVTAICQTAYSSSSLPQHSLGEISFCADTLYQDSDSPHLPTPNHDPHLCQPLIVCEAIGVNAVISETHDTQDEYDTRVNQICLITHDSFDTQNSQTIGSNDSFDTSVYRGIQSSIDTQDSEKTQEYGINECFENTENPNTQGNQDPRYIFDTQGLDDSQDTRACLKTHTSTCRSLNSTATEVSWQTIELKPYSVLSHCYDDIKYCQNTENSNDTQECHEFQVSPSLLQSSESSVSQQIISSSTNSKHNPVCYDIQDTQGSQDTQSRHDTKGSFDLQGGHDTQGTVGSKQCLESQDSHDSQDIQESPITIFQSSVSDVSHQIISSSFLHQQAIDVPLSCVDVPRVTPEQCSLLPQHHDNTHGNNDTQYSHDTHVYYETQGSQNGLENQDSHGTQGGLDNVGHDTQGNNDTQECHESPVTLFQTSVSAVSQQLFTSQFLPKQAPVVPSSCEDALSQFSHRAPVLPHAPLPNRNPDVCQPISVGGGICLNTEICESCDTQDSHGTHCTLGTQGSPDFQGSNESPGNIFKGSVSGDSQQMISSTYEPLSLEDVLSPFPLHALGPIHLQTPDQDPDVCRPLSVREAICLIPVIQGPLLPHPQPTTERNPQAKSSKAGVPGVSRPLCRPSLMDNSELTLELEVSGGVPETTLTWLTEGRSMNSVDGNPSGLIKVQASGQRAALHAADALQDTHFNRSVEKWLVGEVYDIISLDWNTWFGTLCVIFWLLYLVLL